MNISKYKKVLANPLIVFRTDGEMPGDGPDEENDPPPMLLSEFMESNPVGLNEEEMKEINSLHFTEVAHKESIRLYRGKWLVCMAKTTYKKEILEILGTLDLKHIGGEEPHPDNGNWLNYLSTTYIRGIAEDKLFLGISNMNYLVILTGKNAGTILTNYGFWGWNLFELDLNSIVEKRRENN